MRHRDYFWVESGEDESAGMVVLKAPRRVMVASRDQVMELVAALLDVADGGGNVRGRHVQVGFTTTKLRGPNISVKESERIWKEYEEFESISVRGACAAAARATGFSAPTVHKVVARYLHERLRMGSKYGAVRIAREKPPTRPREYWKVDGFGNHFEEEGDE